MTKLDRLPILYSFIQLYSCSVVQLDVHHKIIIIMFIVSNNINSCTYNQSANQVLNTFKTMEKKQIAYVSFFNYILNMLLDGAACTPCGRHRT